jgi:broad specificity phosphatase PhoE
MNSIPETRSKIFRITLLRHGESVGNAESYHQGQSEFVLTDKGRAQARALADYWLKEKIVFDAILSSPLLRARETAEIIASALSVSIHFDPIWKERDNGVLAGLKFTEAAKLHPQPGFINPFESIGESGEGDWELYLRAGRAVQSLLSRQPGSYLVVSHGGILNKVLYVMLGIIPQANFQGAHFRFENTGYAVLEYDPATHVWLLERLNERPHWQNRDKM